MTSLLSSARQLEMPSLGGRADRAVLSYPAQPKKKKMPTTRADSRYGRILRSVLVRSRVRTPPSLPLPADALFLKVYLRDDSSKAPIRVVNLNLY